VTVLGTTLQCSDPIDVCSKILIEVACRRNGHACAWDEKEGVCKMKK
jgi:hypothetical protein